MSYSEEIDKLIEENKWIKKLIEFPCCVICFNSDPRVIEQHHIVGRKHSKITVPTCANCHKRLSRKQSNWNPLWLKKGLSKKQQSAFVLRGVSDLVRIISDNMLGD